MPGQWRPDETAAEAAEITIRLGHRRAHPGSPAVLSEALTAPEHAGQHALLPGRSSRISGYRGRRDLNLPAIDFGQPAASSSPAT